MSDDGWKGLHPASVVVNLLPRTWRVVRQFWPLLLALVWGGRADRLGVVDFGLVLFFFALTVGSTIVHWATLRYRVQGGRLEISTGLLSQQVRTIDPARVQNVQLTRNVFHRLAGLVEVRLETASGDEAEGLLSALSEADATELVGALESARGLRTEPTAEADAPALVSLGVGDLLRYGATATPIGLVLVFVGVGFEALQVVEQDRAEDVLLRLSPLVLAPVLLGLAWFAGLALTVGRHYGFRLLAGERALVAEEGLLTRRRMEIRPDKVQLVTVTEPLFRRWLGFGSVQVETAAAASDSGGTRTAEAMVPVVDSERIPEVVAGIVPLDVDLAGVALRPPHPQALARALWGGVLRVLFPAAVLTFWFWPYGAVSWLLVPASAWAAWFDFRNQGWLVTERAVVVRTGWLRRATRVMPREKVQSSALIQGPFLRRRGLAVLTLRSAGSGAVLPPLAWDETRALLDALVPVSRPPAPLPAPTEEPAPADPLPPPGP